MHRIWIAVLALGVGLNACGDDPPVCPAAGGQEHEGTTTGSACNGSPLNYENFGQEFMENYCTRCHSSALKGEEARACAPEDHNFDSLDGILYSREHIDAHSAAGPNGVNETMPPSGAKPTEQERRDLGTWLACEEEMMQ